MCGYETRVNFRCCPLWNIHLGGCVGGDTESLDRLELAQIV